MVHGAAQAGQEGKLNAECHRAWLRRSYGHHDVVPALERPLTAGPRLPLPVDFARIADPSQRLRGPGLPITPTVGAHRGVHGPSRPRRHRPPPSPRRPRALRRMPSMTTPSGAAT